MSSTGNAAATTAVGVGSAAISSGGGSSSSNSSNLGSLGDQVFARMPKVNGELVNLTYGAIVTQLLRDFENPEDVNGQLETMGYNIGVRLIDELLAKSGIRKCTSFMETMEVTAKIGFKMFLGVSPEIADWNAERTSCSLQFSKDSNPLEDFVELPDELRNTLRYSNILVGIIRGALESVSMRVKVSFVRDTLRGDDITEIKVQLSEVVEDAAGEDYREE